MSLQRRSVLLRAQVTEAQIHNDLSLDKFMWDHPSARGTKSPRQDSVSVFSNAYEVRPV